MVTLSIICICVTIIPIILFVLNFYSQPISKDIDDWASFGSYVSGVVNTFVAVVSLIVLSYLTYFVSKQSSSENKKVNLLMRKLDAYESLVAFLPVLQNSLDNMVWNVKYALKYIDVQGAEKEYEEYLNKVFESVRNFKELNFFLSSFTERYGHLFNYDFDCSDFSELMDRSDENSVFYDKMLENLSSRKREIPSDGQKMMRDFIKSLNKLILSLKSELDTK